LLGAAPVGGLTPATNTTAPIRHRLPDFLEDFSGTPAVIDPTARQGRGLGRVGNLLGGVPAKALDAGVRPSTARRTEGAALVRGRDGRPATLSTASLSIACSRSRSGRARRLASSHLHRAWLRGWGRIQIWQPSCPSNACDRRSTPHAAPHEPARRPLARAESLEFGLWGLVSKPGGGEQFGRGAGGRAPGHAWV